ncbi:MAG: hypothetical protein A3G41_05690 [Elusimicrobia bacterium RIFCSPLOWO2_12_FULL_59_9]|nr:MAG: hypothetical protein A3G41_05690 [Elusimicrobia bacterium RIFCSPLOWO2_12_FULL_59_9]
MPARAENQPRPFLTSIQEASQFSELSGTVAYGRLAAFRQVIFVVDREKSSLFFVNTKLFRSHLDFLKRSRLFYGGTRSLTEGLSNPDRRFLFGVLMQRSTDQYSLEFIEDDPVTPELIEEVFRRVRASFFEPVFFRPRSVAQARSLYGREIKLLPEETTPDEEVEAETLVPGIAVGKLRVVRRGEDLGLGPEDVAYLDWGPDFVPNVAGMILGIRTSPLKHIVLLASSLGIPVLYLRSDEPIARLEGIEALLDVRLDGYSLRPATGDEKTKYSRKKRPRLLRPDADLEFGELTDLSKQRAVDAVRFGAKSANLGELAHARTKELRVPKGFTVPFRYFAEFLFENGLAYEVDEILKDESVQTDSKIRSARLAEVRKKIEDGKLNHALEELLKSKLKGYKGMGVFVRSSTNAEDLPGFTGAGIYTTVPNAIGEEAISFGIRKVWASVYNEGAFEAREAFGIAHDAVFMAVLVQQAMPARSAGVALTSNPRDPSEKNVVFIAAKRGLGTRVVRGDAIPEHILYRGDSDRVERLNPSRDEQMDALSGKGGIKSVAVVEEGNILNESMARQLGRTCLKIQQIFGGLPQDVEWLVADGKLYIVQSRPYVLKQK